MNSRAMETLLSTLLDQQIESGKYGFIDETRLREAMTTGPDFTSREKSLFLLSPIARSDYRRVREDVVQEIKAHLLEKDVALELVPLAAADKDTDRESLSINGHGYSINLYRQADIGVQWVILVQLDNNFMNCISPMTRLRLIDSGGLEWLRGRPDANGELTGTWLDEDVDLLDRMRKYSLSLEPV